MESIGDIYKLISDHQKLIIDIDWIVSRFRISPKMSDKSKGVGLVQRCRMDVGTLDNWHKARQWILAEKGGADATPQGELVFFKTQNDIVWRNKNTRFLQLQWNFFSNRINKNRFS